MSDTSVKKVQARSSPRGRLGQKYLANGIRLEMRLWDEEKPRPPDPMHARAYETVGYVIAGKALLHIEDQVIRLEPGDSWLVPRDARHTYEILEPFTAVEATSPPGSVHARDEAP